MEKRKEEKGQQQPDERMDEGRKRKVLTGRKIVFLSARVLRSCSGYLSAQKEPPFLNTHTWTPAYMCMYETCVIAQEANEELAIFSFKCILCL